MDIKAGPGYCPEPSDLATIRQKIEELNTNPDLIDEWQANGQLALLQDSAEYQIARSASDLTTGLRWRSERDDYERSFLTYKDLIKTVATYEVDKALDKDPNDIDEAKRTLLSLLVASKKGIVESDINRRLEISRIERIKKRSTQNKVARAAGTIAVAAVVTAVGSSAAELLPDFETIDSINPVGVGSGLGFAVGTLVRSQFRKGSIKVGEVLKRRVNSSIDFYDSPELRQILKSTADDGRKPNNEEIHRMLTEYHLRHSLGKLGLLILESDVRGSTREGMHSLIHDAVDCVESSLDEFYGMVPRETLLTRMKNRRTKKLQQSN